MENVRMDKSIFTAGFELLSVCMTEDAKKVIHGDTENQSKRIKKKNPKRLKMYDENG